MLWSDRSSSGHVPMAKREFSLGFDGDLVSKILALQRLLDALQKAHCWMATRQAKGLTHPHFQYER